MSSSWCKTNYPRRETIKGKKIKVNSFFQVQLEKPWHFETWIIMNQWITVSLTQMFFPSGKNIFWLLKILLNLSQEYTATNKLSPEKVFVISPPIIGQYFRINPRSWKIRLSMAVEFYGCYLVDNRSGKRLKLYIWIGQGFPHRAEKLCSLFFT